MLFIVDLSFSSFHKWKRVFPSTKSIKSERRNSCNISNPPNINQPGFLGIQSLNDRYLHSSASTRMNNSKVKVHNLKLNLDF